MMGNLVKKLVASTLSIAFFGMQIAAVAEPIQVLPDGGLGGATIDSAHGGFAGVEHGTTDLGLIKLPNKNDATLNFNGDAVLNWGSLNVEANQQLHFANGSFVVLNNVLQGMSTFAGKVTGEQGHIIISNPNGMLLQGGQFETAGALTLTTKDLTGIKVEDLANQQLLNEKINQAGYKNDDAIITLTNGDIKTFFRGSKVEAGDINILAKKIDISKADLMGQNGVVLSTSDGMNFVAANKNESITVKDSNINVATNAIAKGGVVEFRTNGNVQVNGSDINSLKVAKANNVKIENSDINKLNIEKSNDVSLVSNLFHTIQDIIINNAGKIDVKNYKFNNLTANNAKDVTINNTLQYSVNSDNITLSNVGNVTLDNVKIGNKLDINNAGTVDITADVAGNSIANAVFTATKDLTINNTDFNTLTANRAGNIKINEGLLSVNSIGTANLDSIGDVFIGKVNFDNPLTVSADGNFNLVNSTAEKAILNIGGNAVIESPIKNMTIADSTIGGNLTVDSKVHTIDSFSELMNFFFGNEDMFADVNVNNSKVGGTATLTAWGNVNVNESTLGGLNAISQLGGIDVADSHITGNATFTRPDSVIANIKEFVNDLFGKEYKDDINSTNTAIDGKIYLSAADDANFTSPKNLHFVDPSIAGTLKAQADNKLTFEQTKSDLTVDNTFFDKYQLSAGEELSFVNPGHNLTAQESASDNFTAKLISFFGKNVNLNNIKANSIKAVADNTVNANGIKVNTDNKWENILGKQNTVATFEGKTINSTNSSFNGEVVVNADNATFTQNDGNILKVMDSNISDTLKVTSNGEIYVGSWDKVGNSGEATKIGSLDLDSTNKITIWDTNVAEDALLKASNTIGIYDSEFKTADMTANNVTSSNTNYSSDIKVNADNATFNSKNNLAFKDSNVTNNFKAESNGIIDIVKSVFNKADLSADKVASRETNYSGNIKVNANEANFNSDSKLSFVDSVVNAFKAHSNNDVTIDKNSSVNTSDLKGNNVISNAEHKGTIKVEAENNAAFTSDKDLVFENPVFNGTFTASTKGDVTYNQNGNLTVDESIKLAGNNININAENITSNNAIYEGSVQMNSKGQIQFNNNNTIAGSLIAQAENDITMNGNTQVGGNATVNTTANAIVNGVNANGTLSIENAQNISVNNCSSDRLAIINTLENRFNYAEIFNSNANTTEFANGEYLYIDLTNSSLFNNNRQAIINSANNVDRIVIVPFENALGQEATKNMNNLSQKGVNTVLGSDFSPIAFAAHDTAKRSGIYKAAGDKIFRDTQDIVHITDRFDVDQF